jgi:hypothetical protein
MVLGFSQGIAASLCQRYFCLSAQNRAKAHATANASDTDSNLTILDPITRAMSNNLSWSKQESEEKRACLHHYRGHGNEREQGPCIWGVIVAFRDVR